MRPGKWKLSFEVVCLTAAMLFSFWLRFGNVVSFFSRWYFVFWIGTLLVFFYCAEKNGRYSQLASARGVINDIFDGLQCLLLSVAVLFLLEAVLARLELSRLFVLYYLLAGSAVLGLSSWVFRGRCRVKFAEEVEDSLREVFLRRFESSEDGEVVAFSSLEAFLSEGQEVSVLKGKLAVFPLGEKRLFVKQTTLRGLPCLYHFSLHQKPFGRAVKRLFDLSVSGLGLIFLSPLFLLLAVAVKVDSEGPVFFSQWRVGEGGKKFRMWKFRTMRKDAEEILKRNPELYEEFKKNFKLKNDPRITRVGKWLRETSLDELPQLWNVFKGEMSLVGPRPVVEEELGKYGPFKEFYLSVKPGITGLWQVSGRSDLDYSLRVSLDVFYVVNWSLFLDLKILALTPLAVLKKRGAY